MEELNCHSGTKKQEVFDFVEAHKGKTLKLHYENNIYERWGDDDFYDYDTSYQKDYERLLQMIATHYIHGIKVTTP